jgi:hypothetical protein
MTLLWRGGGSVFKIAFTLLAIIETDEREREGKMKKFKLFSVMIAVALIFGFWGMASAGTLDEG